MQFKITAYNDKVTRRICIRFGGQIGWFQFDRIQPDPYNGFNHGFRLQFLKMLVNYRVQFK